MKKYIQLLICAFLYLPAEGQSGWQTIPNAPTAIRFDDISFINDTVGWVASGSTMFKTTDGGLTWDTLSTLPLGSGYVRSVEFLNDSIGFYGTLTTGQASAALYRTQDGGLTFIKIDSLMVPGGFCGLAHLGNTVIGVGEYNGAAKFCKSVDAGNTWTYQNIQMPGYSFGLVDCYMIDQNNYLISGNSYADERANILRTSDGGSTWQQVAICSAAGVSYLWKMFFVANGVGFASVELQPFIFKTTDYGVSWTEITINNPNATGLGAIGAINDSVIWVGRQHGFGMFETMDGGTTWTYYPNFGYSMDRMALLDSNHVICAGSTIYKYSRGSAIGIFNPAIVPLHHNMEVVNNPVASDMLTVDFTFFQSTFGLLDLIDMDGKIVKSLFRDRLNEGREEKKFSVKELKNGTYTLLFRSNEEFISKKIEILK